MINSNKGEKMPPTVYLLIPKDKIAQNWIDINIDPDAARLGNGVAVEHGYIRSIWNILERHGLDKHFEVRA